MGGTWNTSAGITEISLDPETWTTTDRIVIDNIYHPAVEPVYGEPYTGCGYDYYARKRTTSMPVRWRRERYEVGSSTLIDDAVYVSAINRCDSPTDSGYSTGCRDGYSDICPIAGIHLPTSRCGRPYATLITPGQDAWNEPVYGDVTTTHYRDTFGARGSPH